MSTTRNPDSPATGSDAPAFASTYADERWQGPSFAASWISPPSPQRFSEDPTTPFRGDDHA